MISMEEVFQILNEQSAEFSIEKIRLREASGRILAAPVLSPIDQPPFDKSAMDGWAIRADEKAVELKVIETIAAGDVGTCTIEPGTCAAIMTGAKMPEGAGRVIRVEYSRREGDRVFIEQDDPLENIIHRGENMKAGDVVLTPRVLKPGEIGILASMGFGEVEVVIPPSIGIIATGTELKEPGVPLEDGEIYNSNGHQLMAQADIWGCMVHYYGITPDDPEKLSQVVNRALEETDIVLLSGGVSMGEFDYIPRILEESGVKKLFHRIAVKPGKPLWFGKNDKNFVFGMPGNPVSTFILFEVFVKHLIQRLCGLDYDPAYLRGIMGKTINRKTWDRTEFLPVKWVNEEVFPISYNGSSHLNALAEATGLIIVDRDIRTVEKGATVNVRII